MIAKGGSYVKRTSILAMAIWCTTAGPACAQSDRMTPTPTPIQSGAITLGTGPLPGTTAREAWHRQFSSSFARNVTVATLTPFLPDPAKATGAAVIVAPGGGFRTLSMDNEGADVARALAARGVAAFVLKYRLKPTPPDLAAFERSMAAMFAGGAKPRPTNGSAESIADMAPQLADSRASFALVRRRAAEWHVDPDRVGIVGFSAGAMLAIAYGAFGAGRQAGLRRLDLRTAGLGNRSRWRTAPVRHLGRRRSALCRSWDGPDRKLDRGEASGRIPSL